MSGGGHTLCQLILTHVILTVRLSSDGDPTKTAVTALLGDKQAHDGQVDKVPESRGRIRVRSSTADPVSSV